MARDFVPQSKQKLTLSALLAGETENLLDQGLV